MPQINGSKKIFLITKTFRVRPRFFCPAHLVKHPVSYSINFSSTAVPVEDLGVAGGQGVAE